jgi:threonine dehydratase
MTPQTTLAEPALDARPPGLDVVRETYARILPHIQRTPIHCWRGAELEARVGRETEVILKLELFQYTGTFKARGAVNTMLGLEPEALKRGVTAVSAGNHAVATAYAAKTLGVSAKVVMMASANPARVARAKAYGAEVLSAPTGAEAFALAKEISEKEGRAFIHPFEGAPVAAGTGTISLELDEQAGPLDALIVPIGGGGLCAGISSAMKALQPNCKIYGVEPVGADSMSRSFAAGKPVDAAPVTTVADSLAPPYSLPYSFALCRDHVDRIVTLEDDRLFEAMAVLFREMKLAVEPAGAATTAALFGPLNQELRGKRVGLIVCGANIDIEGFARMVARGNQIAGLV